MQGPTNGSIIITRELDSVIIEIRPNKKRASLIFMSLWLIGWAIGEKSAIETLLIPETSVFENPFLLFWLIGWTFGGLFILLKIAWHLFGQETIKIEKGILWVEKTVNNFGSKKRYHIGLIRQLAYLTTEDLSSRDLIKYSNWIQSNNGGIKFDYRDKTIRIANDIDKSEARKITEKLKGNPNFTEENFA